MFNYVKRLKKYCFKNNTALRTLLLEANEIVFIEKRAFQNLRKLMILSLSGNPVTCIPDELLSSHITLKVLYLINNTISKAEFRFNNMNAIITTQYQICCLTPPEVTCAAKVPWWEKCSDLLAEGKLWVICIV